MFYKILLFTCKGYCAYELIEQLSAVFLPQTSTNVQHSASIQTFQENTTADESSILQSMSTFAAENDQPSLEDLRMFDEVKLAAQIVVNETATAIVANLHHHELNKLISSHTVNITGSTQNYNALVQKHDTNVTKAMVSLKNSLTQLQNLDIEAKNANVNTELDVEIEKLQKIHKMRLNAQQKYLKCAKNVYDSIVDAKQDILSEIDKINKKMSEFVNKLNTIFLKEHISEDERVKLAKEIETLTQKRNELPDTVYMAKQIQLIELHIELFASKAVDDNVFFEQLYTNLAKKYCLVFTKISDLTIETLQNAILCVKDLIKKTNEQVQHIDQEIDVKNNQLHELYPDVMHDRAATDNKAEQEKLTEVLAHIRAYSDKLKGDEEEYKQINKQFSDLIDETPTQTVAKIFSCKKQDENIIELVAMLARHQETQKTAQLVQHKHAQLQEDDDDAIYEIDEHKRSKHHYRRNRNRARNN